MAKIRHFLQCSLLTSISPLYSRFCLLCVLFHLKKGNERAFSCFSISNINGGSQFVFYFFLRGSGYTQIPRVDFRFLLLLFKEELRRQRITGNRKCLSSTSKVLHPKVLSRVYAIRRFKEQVTSESASLPFKT